MNVAITIAGSDSGGGAGIQADLKTFEAHGVFGTTAITAITAQNTLGVRSVLPIPAEMVRAQLEAVFDDFAVRAVKVGMLANREIIAVVARFLALRAAEIPVILDPVMLSTSGHALLEEDAIAALIAELFPVATLVTPNVAEAALLAGTEVLSLDRMEGAAYAIARLGARAVLVKGGDLRGGTATDILLESGSATRFTSSYLHSRNTHGTGCTLSSAIAANMALGSSLHHAVSRAKAYVHEGIVQAPSLGAGHGPLRHRIEGFGA